MCTRSEAIIAAACTIARPILARVGLAASLTSPLFGTLRRTLPEVGDGPEPEVEDCFRQIH